MSLRLGTNVASLRALRHLSRVNESIARRQHRLATGRITARDDPAGVAIASRMRAKIRSLGQAGRNIADGISTLSIAEGAASEIGNSLQRLRELAVQAANGTLSDQDRANLDEEFQDIAEEIDRTANATDFNGLYLLNGPAQPLVIQDGPDGGDTLQITLPDVTTSALGLSSLAIDSAAGASGAIDAIDSALQDVSLARGRIGASINRLESRSDYLEIQALNLEAARSRIEDIDYAAETAGLARDLVIRDATIAVLAQANSQPQALLRLLQF